MERRLTAILAADVVDYSRLLGEDEQQTLAALDQFRDGLFEPSIIAHGGTIIKRLGDGWIVEFGNVSDAVASAVEIQEGLGQHEVIQLRIGVHIGDLTFRDDDIYGDGINIAARLEALAKPGQVLISDVAHHSLDQKGASEFAGGDFHQLKNISRPVAVWRWPVSDKVPPTPLPKLTDENAKPSVAVLPFENLSDDREQDFFTLGVAEDINIELSKFNSLIVIASNSTSKYTDQSLDLKTIGRELAAQYLVEGSVRKSGDRVRVAAQLIEASSGQHVWANRFDGVLADIFDMQDHVTEAIVGAIGVAIDKVEIGRFRRQPPENLAAWELVLQAYALNFTGNRADNEKATKLSLQAIELEPQYSRAYAILAMCHWTAAFVGWAENRYKTLEEALAQAQHAYSLDQNEIWAGAAIAFCQLTLGNMDKSLEAARRTLAIAPCSLEARRTLAMVLGFKGQTEAALEQLEFIDKLNPTDTHSFVTSLARANAHFSAGDYMAACRFSEEARELQPDWIGLYWVYAAAAQLSDQLELAQELVAIITRMMPKANLTMVRRAPMFTQDDVVENLLDGLKHAGLPE